jgi:hypothetical protein
MKQAVPIARNVYGLNLICLQEATAPQAAHAADQVGPVSLALMIDVLQPLCRSQPPQSALLDIMTFTANADISCSSNGFPWGQCCGI